MNNITTGSSQQTPHGSSVRSMHWAPPVNSISNWCITLIQDPHNRHPMDRPQGQHMQRLLRVKILIDVWHHYRIFTADTRQIVSEDNTRGIPYEFKFWLIYHISTGSSQQTQHGAPAKAMHVMSPVGSNSDIYVYIYIYIYITTGSSQLTPYGSHIRIIHGAPLMSSMYYITIGHFFSYICTLLFFLVIIFSICLTKSTFICVLDFWQCQAYIYCFTMINNQLYISWWLNCVIPSICLLLWNGLLCLFLWVSVGGKYSRIFYWFHMSIIGALQSQVVRCKRYIHWKG